jgi:glutamyl-Q tRNA(Asp) synthetase
MTTGTGYRGRFAPSPTGDLHAGSLMAALGSWLFARRAGGRWLVRIEDVDRPREVPGASTRQLAALRAFGLAPDEPVQRQSEREPLYRAALEDLAHRGLAFPCWCSRSDLAAAGGIHRHCVRAPDAGRAPAIRFRVADGTRVRFVDDIRGAQAQDVDVEVGDFVLFRADGLWAYQLAVVVDDAAQGITHVVRGADLLDSTARQILLQQALGLPTPGYAHLPLIVDDEGRKLSKSDASHPVDPARPLPALRHAWAALGQPALADDDVREPAAWLERAVACFDPARVATSG